MLAAQALFPVESHGEMRGNAEDLDVAGHLNELAGFPDDEPFPATAARVPRGKRSGTQRVALPEGWLDDRDDPAPPGAMAEEALSGG